MVGRPVQLAIGARDDPEGTSPLVACPGNGVLPVVAFGPVGEQSLTVLKGRPVLGERERAPRLDQSDRRGGFDREAVEVDAVRVCRA